ncbi:hypothetical protein IJI55_00420 [Candidatus Saccharibacteria bacterium]|nr:hypothetical protein [Candidatus Saccharibacteria bacterium]
MSNYFLDENVIKVNNDYLGEMSVVRILLIGIKNTFINPTTGEPDMRRVSEEAMIRLTRAGIGTKELEVKKATIISGNSILPAIQFKSFAPKTKEMINLYTNISQTLVKLLCQPNIGKAQMTFDHALYLQQVTQR